MKNTFFLILFSTTNASFAEAENTQWVQNSWIELHEQARQDSNILSHWIVNTQVELLNKSDEWCHVRSASNEEGYVECNSIAPAMVTKAKDPMMQFWLAPSLTSWAKAGTFLEKRLSEKDVNTEYEEQELHRYPIPEFDAMKLKVKEPFLINGDALKATLTSDSTDGMASTGGIPEPIGPDEDETSIFNQLLHAGVLAKIQPSLFKTDHDFLFVTKDNLPTIDHKAILSNGPLKVVQYERAFITRDYQSGFWDVGALEVELSNPIYYHEISSAGLVGVSKENRIHSAEAIIGCSGSNDYSPKYAEPIKDYPKVSNPVTAFYLPYPISDKIIKVFTKIRKVATSTSDVTKSKIITDVLIYEIDLNKDGIIDVLALQTQRYSPLNGSISERDQYVNINGIWNIVEQAYEADCT